MSIDAVKSQNINQYITLLSNPTFLKAVKTANEGEDSGKFDALLENLEKLSSLIAKSNEDNSVPETSGTNLESLILYPNPTKDAEEAFWKTNRELTRLIDELIANADMLESMMNLDVIPPDAEEINLFSKFLEIIQELDRELKKIEKQLKAKEVKCEYKLRPSAHTKSGFEEMITFLAK